jgi:hypothetical protein
LLVGHRSSDEHGSALDRQRVLGAAAILTGDHGICASLDLSQVWISAAGSEQVSSLDPGLCGTSTSPHGPEFHGIAAEEAGNQRRVEVYLVPKGNYPMPPAAKSITAIPTAAVKALGCPK